MQIANIATNIIIIAVVSSNPGHLALHIPAMHISLSYRKKLSSNRSNVSVSGNMAYNRDMYTKPKGIKEDYENLEMIFKSAGGHSIANIETADDIYEAISP